MKIIEIVFWNVIANKIKMFWANNEFVLWLRYLITNKEISDKFFIFVIIIINFFWFASLFGTLSIMLMDFVFYTYTCKIWKVKKD